MPRGLLNAAAKLDAVIAELAASEWARLTDGLSEGEKVNRVLWTLDSLHGSIRRLEMPAYDLELVALFYLTWYQPFQINSAYSLLTRAIAARQDSLPLKTHLDIVDFGGGALAMEVGLALAVGEAHRTGNALPDINVMVVEPSLAMARIGFTLWGRFLTAAGYVSVVDLASQRASARVGSSAFVIKAIDDPAEIDLSADADRWLVAMHAYYAEDEERIQQDLSTIHRVFQPEIGLMTFHNANRDGIEQVSPFTSPGSPTEISALRLAGELSLVSRWRRCLAHELGLCDEQMLIRSVEWDPVRGPRDNRAMFFHCG